MMNIRFRVITISLFLACLNSFCTGSNKTKEANQISEIENLEVMGDNKNQAPEIENLEVMVDTKNHHATIVYDVLDMDNDQLEVQLSVSNDYGKSFTVYLGDISGDKGFPVTPGKGKKIIWNFPSFIYDIDSYQFKLLVTDREPVAVAKLVASVSEDRIRQDIERLIGPRDNFSEIGRTNLDKLQKIFKDEINEYGLIYASQAFKAGNIIGKNVLGKIKGHRQEAEVIILGGHMDTVEGSPGADDNTSGIVGMMEAMRILSDYQFDKTIVFAGWDLEEKGSLGSSSYVTQGGIKLYERVNCYINLDMIGTFKEKDNTQFIPEGFDQVFPEVSQFVKKNRNRGDFLLCISNDNSEPYLDRFKQSIATYVPTLKSASIVVGGYGTDAPRLRDSDHSSFWDYDIPALFLGDGGETRNQNIDSPQDVIKDLNISKMTEVVKSLVAFLASEANLIHGDIEINKQIKLVTQ